jgi:hypothetical protein
MQQKIELFSYSYITSTLRIFCFMQSPSLWLLFNGTKQNKDGEEISSPGKVLSTPVGTF